MKLDVGVCCFVTVQLVQTYYVNNNVTMMCERSANFMDKNTQLLERDRGLGSNKLFSQDLLRVNAIRPLHTQDPEPIRQAEHIWYLHRGVSEMF